MNKCPHCDSAVLIEWQNYCWQTAINKAILCTGDCCRAESFRCSKVLQLNEVAEVTPSHHIKKYHILLNHIPSSPLHFRSRRDTLDIYSPVSLNIMWCNAATRLTPPPHSATDALALVAILSSEQYVTANFLDTPKAHLPPPDTELNNAAGVPVRLIEMQFTSSSCIHYWWIDGTWLRCCFPQTREGSFEKILQAGVSTVESSMNGKK